MRVPVQRLRIDLAGRVKYSILCPSRRNWPWEARRAMPINFGSGGGSRGNEPIRYSPFVRYARPAGFARQLSKSTRIQTTKDTKDSRRNNCSSFVDLCVLIWFWLLVNSYL